VPARRLIGVFSTADAKQHKARVGNAAEHGPPYITAATNCGDFSAALRLGAKLPIDDHRGFSTSARATAANNSSGRLKRSSDRSGRARTACSPVEHLEHVDLPPGVSFKEV